MSERNAQLRTFVLPAAHSPLALVIRRGPSKWWHFLLWDRDTGMVTPGSWFHGIIHPAACDLSPRGDWMLILAYRATNDPPAWTALCHPPSVSAQVFWPLEHARHGGGFFDGRLAVAWLNFPESASAMEERVRHPWEVGYLDADTPTPFGGIAERLERDGWKAIKPTAADARLRWRKPSPRKNGELVVEFLGTADELRSDPARFHEASAVVYTFTPMGSGSVPVILEGVGWAGFNSRGEIAIARGTALALLKAGEMGTFVETPVMDLAGLSPREAPPRAKVAMPAPGFEA